MTIAIIGLFPNRKLIFSFVIVFVGYLAEWEHKIDLVNEKMGRIFNNVSVGTNLFEYN